MKLTPGELYFIREVDVRTERLTPYVKIGIVREKAGEERTSEDRALEHQTGNPRKLFVDSIIKTPAVSEIENIIHNLNAEERIYGEWFEFTDEQLDLVKNAAKELVRVATNNKEKFALAEVLAETASKPEMVKPTKEITQWHSRLLTAEIRINECKSLQAQIKTVFKGILAEPDQTATQNEKQNALAPFVKVQEKKMKMEFNLDAFASERADLYGEFTRVFITAPKGSFTITRPKNFIASLEKVDPDLYHFSILAKEFLSKFESKKATQEDLHVISLKLLGFEANASWDKEIAQINLKVFCQDYSGIEGICKWNRQSKEVAKFDKDAFIKSHPKIAEKYKVEVQPSASLIVQRKRTYSSKKSHSAKEQK
jgi:hypothetical protein